MLLRSWWSRTIQTPSILPLVGTPSHEQMIHSTSLAALAVAAVSYAGLPATCLAQELGHAPASPRACAAGSVLAATDSATNDLLEVGVAPYGGSHPGLLAGPAFSSGADSEPAPVEAKADKKIDVEEVQFATRDKLTLTADFYPPRGKGRAPAVLLIHDAGSNRKGFEDIAVKLQKAKFAVLALDLRGHGASVSEGFDWSRRADADKELLWTQALRDIQAATDFLRGRKDVHNANLSVVGVGAGAALAVRYALNEASVRAVVMISPQIEAYGFNMYKDVVGLEGLPTMILIQSKQREEAERMQAQAHKRNDGLEYVDIKALNPKDDEDPLSDKNIPRVVTKFLGDEAMPNR